MEVQTSQTSNEHNEQAHPKEAGAGGQVRLTESAVRKVKAFAASSKEVEGKPLRVYVQGGGCSGFEYGFTFDEKREDDEVLSVDGIEVVLDPVSLPYLKGCTVDYVEDFRGSGFSVQNPNATGSCGCGHSFSV